MPASLASHARCLLKLKGACLKTLGFHASFFKSLQQLFQQWKYIYGLLELNMLCTMEIW